MKRQTTSSTPTGKANPSHNVMADFNANVGGQTNTSERATECLAWANEMKEETLW